MSSSDNIKSNINLNKGFNSVSNWFNNQQDKISNTLKGIQSTNSIVDVVNSLKRSVDNNENDSVVIAVIAVITDICEQPQSEKNKEKLCKLDVLNYLNDLLNIKSKNIEIIQSILKVCTLLSDLLINKTKFISSNIYNTILISTKSHLDNVNICNYCCIFIQNMSSDENFLNKISSNGVCEICVNIINNHNNNNITLENTCKAIYNLCKNSPTNKNKFGNVGGIEAIINNILKKQLNNNNKNNASVSVEIVGYGLRVIGIMSQNHSENASKFMKMGINNLLNDLYKVYTIDNSNFMKLYLQCIANLVSGSVIYQNEFINNGFDDIILITLSKYTLSKDARVIQECFRTLKNLCHENNNVQQVFYNKSVVIKIIECMRHFGTNHNIHNYDNTNTTNNNNNNEIVVQWGWYVLSSLAMYTPNLEKIKLNGGFIELINGLTSFINSEEVCTWICLAGTRLIVDSECCIILLTNNMIRILSNVIIQHNSCEMIIQDGCQILGTLITRAIDLSTTGDKNNELISKINIGSLIARTSVAEAICKTIQSHSNDEASMEQACYAAYSLTLDRESCAQNLVNYGILKILPNILQNLYNSRPVMLWCLKTINELCDINIEHLSILTSSGLCYFIVPVLHCHAEDSTIITLGVNICTFLSQSLDNIKILFQYNIIQVITKILLLEIPNEEIISECLLLIKILCNGNNESQKLLGQHMICEEVINILNKEICKKNIKIIIIGCNTLTILAKDCQENNLKLGQDNSNAIQWCIEMMKLYFDNIEILIKGCLLLSVLAENGKNCNKMSNFSAYEIVLKSIHKFPNNIELSIAACNAIGNMSSTIDAKQNKIGEINACETIISILEQFVDNILICKWACRAIYKLSNKHINLRKQFAEVGACKILVKVLSKHSSTHDVIEPCCTALSILVDGSASNAQFVVSEGICSSLAISMNTNIKSVGVTIATCKLVCALSETNNDDLADVGICEIVLKLFKSHVSESAQASHWCCRAIASLSSSSRNQTILGEYKACEDIAHALTLYVASDNLFTKVLVQTVNISQSNLINNINNITNNIANNFNHITKNNNENNTNNFIVNSEDVALWASNAVSQLAVNNITHNIRFGSLGVCESLVRVLTKFSSNELIAIAVCRAMCILLKDQPNHILKVGMANGCAAVVEILIQHPGNEIIAGTACRVIKFLAQNKEINLIKLANAGACETVPVAIQTHQTSSFVASNGCGALAALATNIEYVKRMGYSGACEAVVFSLKRHVQNDRLVERASRAIGRLALHTGNSAWLGPAGACEALMQAQEKHLDNEYIAAAAFGAMGNLAIEENNRLRLIQQGCCIAVVQAMDRHANSEDVCRMTAKCITKLTLTDSAKQAMFDPKLCEILCNSLDRHSNSLQVLLQLNKTIRNLAKNNRDFQNALGSLNCCSKLIKIMNDNKTNDLIVIECCWALCELTLDNINNQKQCIDVHIEEILLQMIKLYFSNETFAEAFCDICRGLCKGNLNNTTIFLNIGLIGSIIKLFNKHKNNITIVLSCTHSLHYILNGHPFISEKYLQSLTDLEIGNITLCELLIYSLTKYGENITPTSIDLVIHTCECMVNLCDIKLGQIKLGQASASKIIITLLQCHESTLALSSLCRVIAALSLNYIENINKIVQRGGCKIIATILDKLVEKLMAQKSQKTNLKKVTTNIRKSIIAVNSGVTDIALATKKAAHLTANVVSNIKASSSLNDLTIFHNDNSHNNDDLINRSDSPASNEDENKIIRNKNIYGDSSYIPDLVSKDDLHIKNTTKNNNELANKFIHRLDTPELEIQVSSSPTIDGIKFAEMELIEACCSAIVALCSLTSENQEAKIKFAKGTDICRILNTLLTSLISNSNSEIYLLIQSALETVSA